jgi:hypothetical protein
VDKLADPPENGGGERIAEIRSFYPVGQEPMADTTLGFAKVSAIIEVTASSTPAPSE